MVVVVVVAVVVAVVVVVVIVVVVVVAAVVVLVVGGGPSKSFRAPDLSMGLYEVFQGFIEGLQRTVTYSARRVYYRVFEV